MAASSPSQGGSAKGPKMMSSRLATMKFMQRASASVSNPTSPSPSRPESPSSTPQNQGTPPSAKRAKLSHSPSDRPDASRQRQAALEGAWRGDESKWNFAVRDGNLPSGSGLKVEIVQGRSFGDDSEDESTSRRKWRTEDGEGRKTFGQKSKNIPVKEDTETNDDDGSGSSSSDSDDSFDDEVRAVLDKPDSDRGYGNQRRSNGISGGMKNLDRTQCYNCSGFGHLSRDCPNGSKKRSNGASIGGRSKG